MKKGTTILVFFILLFGCRKEFDNDNIRFELTKCSLNDTISDFIPNTLITMYFNITNRSNRKYFFIANNDNEILKDRSKLILMDTISRSFVRFNPLGSVNLLEKDKEIRILGEIDLTNKENLKFWEIEEESFPFTKDRAYWLQKINNKLKSSKVYYIQSSVDIEYKNEREHNELEVIEDTLQAKGNYIIQ